VKIGVGGKVCRLETKKEEEKWGEGEELEEKKKGEEGDEAILGSKHEGSAYAATHV